MKIDKLRHSLLAAMLASFTTIGLANHAQAYDVYHTVHAAANGAVDWSLASFGVSGVNPNLSFFYAASDVEAQQLLPRYECFVKVHLANTVAHPPQNAQDFVGDVSVAIGGPNNPLPFPWRIVFDNVPPGHWNIGKGEMVNMVPQPPPSNNTASRVAALGFHNLAFNANNFGVTVINGSQQNCVR